MPPLAARPPSRRYRLLANGVAAGFGRLLLAPRVSGGESIPAGGAVIALNHDGFLDALLLMQVTGRQIRVMAAAGWLRVPVVGWLLRACGAFPVRRGAADRSAIERAAEIARGGDLIGIFPEGNFVRGPGLGPLHRGAASIALRAGVPIVPVAIGGHSLRARRGTAFVRIGEAIAPVGSSRELTTRLEQALRSLLAAPTVERPPRRERRREDDAGERT